MADTDIGWAHADALKSMLDTATSYPSYIAEVDTPDDELEYPHYVLWPPPANRPTTTMAGYGGEATTTTQITAAGRDVREVLAALDRATATLHRRRPVIAGRTCSLITQVPAAEPPQPERDPDVATPERPVFYSFVQVTLTSSPIEVPDWGS